MASLPSLEERARALLDGNRVRAADGRYTRPARKTYPHQWLWDSCFHAIVSDLLGDRAFAHDEIRALFRAQVRDGLDRGRLPHMTLFGGDPSEAAQDPDGANSFARDRTLWGNPRASTITQPPIVAETVLRVGDDDLFRELFEPLCAYYDFWLRRRDPDDDGLYAIWHPWESGADATPRADEAMLRLSASGRVPALLATQTVNPTAKKREDLLRARFLLVEDLHALDAHERDGTLPEFEAQRRRTALAGHEAVDMQAWLARNLEALAEIAKRLNEHDRAQRYLGAAARIAESVNAKLWDEAAGFYFDRLGAEERVVRIRTPAAFVALYAGDMVPRERAERLLAHILDPIGFFTRWPVPTVARDEPTFDPDEYWRGSTWINVNWFTVRGLIHSAERFSDERYLAAARTIAERTVDLVEKLGFREYYRSGAKRPDNDAAIEPAAFGPESFGWSTLAVDFARMLEQDLRNAKGIAP